MKKLLSAIALLSLTLFAANAQQTEADFVFEPACYGNPTVLTSTSSVHPLDSIVLYAWDLDGDLSFDDAVGAVISHVFPGPDYEHQVGLKITTKFNITKSIYKQVEVSDLDVDFNWVNTCEGDITIFTDLTDVINDNIASWIWEFDTTGPAASIQQNPTYTYPDWGSYIARLTVTTDNGCTDNVDKTIEVFPVPQVTLDPVNMQAVDPSALIPEFSFYEGEVLEIAVNIFGTYTNILWSDGQTGLTALFNQQGDYAVTVTNEKGCSGSAYFVIRTTLRNDFDPTTVITPNGDGFNDFWLIKPVILPDESFEVMVYNRWGDQVYSSPDYKNDWGGTYEGELLPEGAYYYIVRNNRNPEDVRKGDINIILR